MSEVDDFEICCKGCGRIPSQISEYIMISRELNITPEQAVKNEEGTYNKETGRFYCTRCYVKVGMPLGTA